MEIKGNYMREIINEAIDFLDDPETNTRLFRVKFGTKYIAIYISVDPNLEGQELQLSHNIGHLIAYYLNKFQKEFNEIFKDCRIENRDINIFIFADSYSKRSPLINSNLSSKVSPENPIYFTSSSNAELFEIIIVYSIDHIDELFTLENNHVEQLIIKNVLINLYSELRKDLKNEEIEEKAVHFIEQNLPDGIPGFTLEKLAVINERILNYSPPLDVSVTSKEAVENLIIEFLRNNSIKPGKYVGEELKQILNDVFTFLQSELEKEIKNHNNTSLYFTYAQIEFLRNYRESMEISFGISQRTYTEYDVVEEKAKMLDEVVIRNNGLQHLIETILKVNSKNGKDINIEDFQYLEALSTRACEIALISDLIHYKLIPYEISIKEDYSFEIDEKETFDSEDYLINHSKRGLHDDFIKYEIAKNVSEEVTDENGLGSEYDSIEKAFENEFGFKYTEFLNVIFILAMRINPPNDDYYPMIYLDQNSLVKEIKNIMKDVINQEISDSTIIKILEFLSLPYETFKEQDPFLPNLLRMNKNRFNIKPLIKFLDNGKTSYYYGVWSVYSAGGIYSNKISTGRFPYQLGENELKKELKKMERLHNKKLEREVDKLASDIFGPENVVSNLEKFKNIDESLPNKPKCGEIDCLAVDKSNKIIHVLEAKDVVKARIPKELRNEFNKFFDPNKKNNYSAKLMEKVEFVSKHLELFLKHFNIYDTQGWSIEHVFVTYEVHLSAFHKVNDTEFIPLTELNEYLRKNKE